MQSCQREASLHSQAIHGSKASEVWILLSTTTHAWQAMTRAFHVRGSPHCLTTFHLVVTSVCCRCPYNSSARSIGGTHSNYCSPAKASFPGLIKGIGPLQCPIVICSWQFDSHSFCHRTYPQYTEQLSCISL